MKRLLFVVTIAMTFLPCVPAEAGLFGPSRRELMQKMLEQQQQANAHAACAHQTLHRIEVGQAVQTELLRQIAGHSQAAAANTQRAADVSSHLLTRPLRDYPALPGDAPRDIRGLPDVPATLPNLRSTAPLPGDAPSNLRGVPEANISGPILQGTSGRVYYVRQPEAKRVQPPTNYSLKN